MRPSSVVSVAVAAAVSGPLHAQMVPPPDWKWALDSPAQLVNSQFNREVPDSEFRFVMMPPGYHITTGPAATLFHPVHRADGIFTLESEIFLFPNSTDGEYGLFIGGTDLEADGRAYTAFVARRDGATAVLRRAGSTITPLVAWARHDSVKAPNAEDAVKNVLRVAVERAAVVFTVNGAEVARVPRDSVATDGLFGFRVGQGVNLHVTTLDFTRRLAPPRGR
jgi:hypothetical protein